MDKRILIQLFSFWTKMDLFEESLERIKRMVRPNCIHVGYQYGLARYLGFCANKKFPLL